MLLLAEIFRNKTPVPSRLTAYGFCFRQNSYVFSTPILKAAFTITVFISPDGNIHFQVIDSDTQEEYLPVHITDIQGAFVRSVQEACEEVLKDIAEKCFVTHIFKMPQTKELIEYVRQKYGDEPEFLWQKFPDNAIWRRKDNRKWYGALLTVPLTKLGVKSTKTVEIINLRGDPLQIEQLIDNKTFFPAWHMNKKNWLTIVSNDLISTETVTNMIDTSYCLAKK